MILREKICVMKTVVLPFPFSAKSQVQFLKEKTFLAEKEDQSIVLYISRSADDVDGELILMYSIYSTKDTVSIEWSKSQSVIAYVLGLI